MEICQVKKLLGKIPLVKEPIKVQFIDKGWSGDRKFFVKAGDGCLYCLRISPSELGETKRRELKIMEKISELGIKMSLPLEIGEFGDNIFTLLSWVEGDDLEENIQNLTEEKQYFLGLRAGEVLKKIHTINPPKTIEKWEERMGNKIGIRLERYWSSRNKLKNGEHAERFIRENIHLLKDRPQALQHGDFHTGNLILTPEKDIGVIDFNRWDYGDPFEDFYKMFMFSRESSIPFCRGQLDGYFPEGIPDDFFPLLALYLASVSLFSIVWAEPFGEEEVKSMTQRCEKIISDWDNFHSSIPGWLSKYYFLEGGG